MVAVIPADCIALAAAFSRTVQRSAAILRISVIPAAYILADVASDGSCVSDKRGSNTVSRFSQCLAGLCHILRISYISQLRDCTDGNPVAFILNVCTVLNCLQIDNPLRIILKDMGCLLYTSRCV